MAGQIDIFILMAGLGSRFRSEGFDTPKPLIKFRGQPLFVWALKSVRRLLPQSNLHLVLCAEDNIKIKVETELAKLEDFSASTTQIITVPKRTTGPLESALQAVRKTAAVDRRNPVIFCDCDLYFESDKWVEGIKGWLSGDNAADAILATYPAAADKYSFVKLNSAGFATEVAEKRVISENAIAGFYAFKNSKLFLENGNSVLLNQATVSNEHYISQVYNELIKGGHAVKVYETEKILLLGTPEEIEDADKK